MRPSHVPRSFGAHEGKEIAMSKTSTTETAPAEANRELVRGAYDAFARGDIPGAMAALAEDVLWHVPGRGPLSREYRALHEALRRDVPAPGG